jgi:hypothetical protein
MRIRLPIAPVQRLVDISHKVHHKPKRFGPFFVRLGSVGQDRGLRLDGPNDVFRTHVVHRLLMIIPKRQIDVMPGPGGGPIPTNIIGPASRRNECIRPRRSANGEEAETLGAGLFVQSRFGDAGYQHVTRVVPSPGDRDQSGH